jgi:antitoxin component YwqK of YwqJK toxin-antitoxin module
MMPFKPVTAETTEMSTTYPDGKPSMKAGLRAGTYHGKYTSWYPDGTVFREANYDNDEEEGVFNTFYPGKILKETITYKDGFRNGKYSLYHPNGKIRLRGSFCYNEEVDAWELFDETGRHTTTYFYDYGKLYEIRTY